MATSVPTVPHMEAHNCLTPLQTKSYSQECSWESEQEGSLSSTF